MEQDNVLRSLLLTETQKQKLAQLAGSGDIIADELRTRYLYLANKAMTEDTPENFRIFRDFVIRQLRPLIDAG